MTAKMVLFSMIVAFIIVARKTIINIIESDPRERLICLRDNLNYVKNGFKKYIFKNE